MKDLERHEYFHEGQRSRNFGFLYCLAAFNKAFASKGFGKFE